jgi:AraC-like DNA-binding protein
VQHKLNDAVRLLSDARQPRADFEARGGLGVSQPSAFTRAFRGSFGLSPKAVQGLAEQSRENDIQLMTSAEPLQYFQPLSDATPRQQ